MKNSYLTIAVVSIALALALAGCGGEGAVDVSDVLAKPKAYVGSETCKMCHLEHYDSWKMTIHSRATQDAQKNLDAIVGEYSEKLIRTELTGYGDKLKVPVDDIYIPKLEEIRYVINSRQVQGFVIEKNGILYEAPIEYNILTEKWGPSNEADWDKTPWLNGTGGFHLTGVDLDKNTFAELSISCEACHGKGSWHAALPKTEVFQKRQTIVNPAKLSTGSAVQVCGSCHNRGISTKRQGVGWPIGYQPGKPLGAYFKSVAFKNGDTSYMYPNEYSKAANQEYIDWKKSIHAEEGVTCTSCHYVHQLGIPSTSAQTINSGSQQCLSCHRQVNNLRGHAIHSFANCVGCHMPRIAGGTRSHSFNTLLPQVTVEDPRIPNSCQACHKHKDQDPEDLQELFEM
ncbi:MAG: ammonia-forming cytochrome c nitrite reductase subunit c552 [Deltaproteobacteria bacterium]|nr:ammonia-forming cytochrome c nitrite reductase subunit c552 [Deltaproteobacteria bacterium]MBW2053020.1 ammonia-forming cytochrome c nitrite reductase subunit c552 [Deltaproteobacteria bacterium]MBW2141430.1 ammonia-forming cytochrome c nitrite reductase subunit c552 [Deltaproteobacteria bacterium]MBW2323354.1 ammonia-forming cytochrome c nitrite reductase subunit c552 [Deltaproteobacteria bacterium]